MRPKGKSEKRGLKSLGFGEAAVPPAWRDEPNFAMPLTRLAGPGNLRCPNKTRSKCKDNLPLHVSAPRAKARLTIVM